MKLLLAVTTLLIALATPVCAADTAAVQSLSVYTFIDYFTWREFQDSGQRILREEGPLYGVGGDLLINLYDQKLLFKGKGELFGSVIDYRGRTQIDTTNAQQSERPVNTSVDYVGTRLEGDLGWRLPLPVVVEPFAGVGWRWWLRGLQDSTAFDTNGVPFAVSGYTESWHSVYAKVGARAQYPIGRGLNLFAEGAAKYPFYVANSVDFAGSGKVTFRPEGQWSAIGELGVTYRHLRVSAYYEGFEVGSSPLIAVDGKLFLQPHSTSDIVGARVGWSF